MRKIYRVSGLQKAGSASVLARAVSRIDDGLRVAVDVEKGLVDIDGCVPDFKVAQAVADAECTFLGPVDPGH